MVQTSINSLKFQQEHAAEIMQEVLLAKGHLKSLYLGH